MDTIWIMLTAYIANGPVEKDEHVFMFGRGGVTRFAAEDGDTVLYDENGKAIGIVEDSVESIFKVIKEFRRSNGKQDAKTKGSRKTPHAKAKSKV